MSSHSNCHSQDVAVYTAGSLQTTSLVGVSHQHGEQDLSMLPHTPAPYSLRATGGWILPVIGGRYKNIRCSTDVARRCGPRGAWILPARAVAENLSVLRVSLRTPRLALRARLPAPHGWRYREKRCCPPLPSICSGGAQERLAWIPFGGHPVKLERRRRD